MEYKNVGDHVEDLADGRMVAPGETIEISEDDAKIERNADLISGGRFLALEEVKATDSAREFAADKGVNLNAITGTGRDGQITQADVEGYIRENGEEDS
jgi:pyruvate/2-oxoglutarate dehydrogenase complex dihydrolipoamide acyltransferase (E2) component